MNCHRHARDTCTLPYRFPPHCVKYPPAHDIELLVDDSEAVVADGRRHGFRVLHVDPADPDWAAQVLAAVDRPKSGERS